ncbi:GIY-YIG nuclease family protein [Odoribacter laneus]|uniref:GIY-YIG nuclease family protein n=1 Tax=Odoribacter laneus TaxID=626933 RepID=UPI003AF78A9D
MAYPQTIQIFLPDGNPRGIKIAEITNRTIKAILFPRNQFEAILQRPELANVGFYFLFGVADNGHEMAYIGEAEDCAERLKQHQRNKDFWNYAVVIISQTHAFTKTHVKYLEYVAIKKASETGRYDLDNSAIPNRPHITESMEADAEDCFEIAKVLLSTLGFPLFDSVAREVVASTPVDVYKLKGNGVEAEGSLVDDGFVVFKDSEVKATTVPSCHDYLINMRNELIQSGILTLDGEAYRFTEDYVFSSPSTAGGVILGRSTNGWTKWRTVNGKTLDEMKRQVN